MTKITKANRRNYCSAALISSLFLLFFGTSCGPKPGSFAGQKWLKKDLYSRNAPLVLDFSRADFQYYDFGFHARPATFENQFDSLIIKELNREMRFKISYRTADSLVLVPDTYDNRPAVYVRAKDRFRNRKQLGEYLDDREGLKNGQNRSIFSLLEALQGETVEDRLRKLAGSFAPGDYLSSETLFILAGLPLRPRSSERDDLRTQREIISRIERIFKHKELFSAELKNLKPLSVSLPIYTNPSPTAKPALRADLVIRNGAKIVIQEHPKGGLSVNIDGVKIGKGLLMTDLPPMLIRGNRGRILGIEFPLMR